MKTEELVLILFSITGLIFLNFFSPLNNYEQKTIQETKNHCTGLVKIKANLAKSFVSRKGARIGVVSNKNESIMAVLDNFYYPSKNLTFYAKASEYGDSCWLFVNSIQKGG